MDVKSEWSLNVNDNMYLFWPGFTISLVGTVTADSYVKVSYIISHAVVLTSTLDGKVTTILVIGPFFKGSRLKFSFFASDC